MTMIKMDFAQTWLPYSLDDLVLQRENAIVTPWDIVMKTAEFSNK
jgi:hypothetical protein